MYLDNTTLPIDFIITLQLNVIRKDVVVFKLVSLAQRAECESKKKRIKTFYQCANCPTSMQTDILVL